MNNDNIAQISLRHNDRAQKEQDSNKEIEASKPAPTEESPEAPIATEPAPRFVPPTPIRLPDFAQKGTCSSNFRKEQSDDIGFYHR